LYFFPCSATPSLAKPDQACTLAQETPSWNRQHTFDLMRYLGGEVKAGELSALCVDASDSHGSAGYLTSIQEVIQEQSIPPP